MNILTFDIEDWYNCDFISQDFNWDKYEVRIYQGVERIIEELERRSQKATFFCLGWIAERHPDVIRMIHEQGHHIGCHSYQHELSFRFDERTFKEDTLKAKYLLEDIIGEEVNAFRAPGFSITGHNVWALESLAQMGFKYDCSLVPAHHDYGGMPTYGKGVPKIIDVGEGQIIKEFPINTVSFMGKPLVFSGGGFFRLLPYPLIKKWGRDSEYMMTYFHPRDFDPDQPVMRNLPLMRRFKSYVGLKTSFAKFQKILDDFQFLNIVEADAAIDWTLAEKMAVDSLNL